MTAATVLRRCRNQNRNRTIVLLSLAARNGTSRKTGMIYPQEEKTIPLRSRSRRGIMYKMQGFNARFRNEKIKQKLKATN
ncbi:MAG: hypothetical protein D3914_02995 [Candidatus Electrothrix sp. LOE2]|nr:hypothetical protein [Candidatus Electrothrix sp. LOE2]